MPGKVFTIDPAVNVMSALAVAVLGPAGLHAGISVIADASNSKFTCVRWVALSKTGEPVFTDPLKSVVIPKTLTVVPAGAGNPPGVPTKAETVNLQAFPGPLNVLITGPPDAVE